MTPWVRRAVVVFPLLSILTCLLIWADASAWARYFHDYRLLFNDLGQTPPPPQPTPPLTSYLGVLIILPEIVFVMWQYRAARVARALSYPARRSPAWGVVAYLVPVADLFVPAQALGDCLPPGDPGRRLVARTWGTLLVLSVAQSSLIVLLAEVRPVGVIMLAVAIAADLVLLRSGRQMVDAITANHHHAAGRGQAGQRLN